MFVVLMLVLCVLSRRKEKSKQKKRSLPNSLVSSNGSPPLFRRRSGPAAGLADAHDLLQDPQLDAGRHAADALRRRRPVVLAAAAVLFGALDVGDQGAKGLGGAGLGRRIGKNALPVASLRSGESGASRITLSTFAGGTISFSRVFERE